MNKCLKLIVALFCVNIMAASLLKANNLVSYKGSKLSSINANYSRSKSSTMVKQTVLSSITAKELDIEVGANTDLKGSLIAAGYYDESGNFIDNGKLRLKTDTLTFSNLSNTRYDKSNSLSIGANYAFKDPQQGEGGSKDGGSKASDSKNAESKDSTTDPKSKISSINYSNNRNLSYSISKSLATIGKGELIVGDKDISSLSKDELASLQSDPNNKALYNSDDLTRLNRDSSKLNKELYSTKLSSNVDASVDMRLFSERGRNEIKRDAQDASTIYDAIYQIATTDRVSFTDFFSENGKGFMVVNGVRQELANNPELRWMLQSDELSDQEKQAITQNITRQVMLNLGYIPNQTKTIYTDETGRDGKQIMGFYSLQTGRSYINIKNNESTKDLVATSATESQRAMDHQRGINFLKNEDDHSTYSRNFGNAVARYYGYALSSYGSGYGSAKINNPSSINQNYYAGNNKEFSRLDKQKGANRQLLDEEVHKIYELSKIYSEKKNIPLEKGTAIVSKAFYGLVDKDANDMYETNLDTEEAFEYLEAQDFLKSKIDYSRIIPTYDDNEFSGIGWAFKEQYNDRYSNLKGYSRNKKFYEKYLKIDNPANTFSFSGLADSIKNFADGFTKPFKDLANEATNNTSEFLKATAIGILNPFKSGSNFGENSHKTHEEANLDDFLGDKQGRDQKRGEIAGNIAPIIAGGTIGSILKKGKNIHKAGDVGTAEGAGATKLSTNVGETTGTGSVKTPAAISGKVDLQQSSTFAKPAPSTGQKKVFVDSKSDLATLLENTNADILVTSKGLAIDVKWLKNILAGQGTSIDVGKLTGLKDASIAKIVSRLPKDWKVVLQNDGNGIKFVDKNGVDRVRIHGPSSSKHIPENSNARQGWVLRISEKKNDTYIYYDDAGNIKGAKTNETHIPIKGNPNAEK